MKTTNKGSNPWTNALTKKEKQRVQDHALTVDFSVGETIIKQGVAANHILYLESGMAKLMVSDKGKNTTFKIVPGESFIGLMCSFVQRSFDFSAIAIKQSRVRMIDRDVFEDLIRHNGEFAVEMVEYMSAATNKIVHDLIHLSHKNADGALCTILLELVRIMDSQTFHLPFTRTELADMIGYSKESVIHTLSSLQKEGILKASGKKVEILDMGRLDIISRHG